MSNMVNHARFELKKAGLYDKDSDYGGMLGEAVEKLIEAFAEQGHSGFSAGMAISLFEKLARFEPITPLTGEPDEWNEVGSGVLQNRRCSRVFKENNESYDIDGKVFREKNGSCFTNIDSRVLVVFPYIPKTEYVNV